MSIVTKKTTKKYKNIHLKPSVYICVLHQDSDIAQKELIKRFPQFSERLIYRHATAIKFNT